MKKYQKRLEKLNRLSSELIASLEEAGDRLVRRRPVENAWTPLETLKHIYLVERSSVDYLLYKFGQDDNAAPGLSPKSRLAGKVLAAALVSPLKFSAPQSTNVSQRPSRETLDVDAIKHDLHAVRHELKQLFEQMPASWERGATFRHPIAGRISLNDMMLFMVLHHQRHAKQIHRALAQNSRNNRR